jgi:hypothetical protein
VEGSSNWRRLPVSSWIERDAFPTAAGCRHRGKSRDAPRYPALYLMIDEAKVSAVHNGIDLESWHPASRG